MATELTVPTLGMDMTEATIVRWLVSEGETVEKGDPVLEIDTDKTSFEVEAPDDGVISNIRGEEGETLAVGTLVAYILAPDEKAPERPAPDAARNETVNGKRLRASPAARRLAAERGIKLLEVAGSGPNGRVYLSDVKNFEAAPSAGPETRGTGGPAAFPEAAIVSGNGSAEALEAVAEAGTHREPLTQVRRIGAGRTQRSFAEVPHFYLRRDMDAGGLVALRSRLKERLEAAPSLNDLIAFAVSRTLTDHPRLDARYDEESGDLVIHESVNLGIAAATEKGLVVPVLKGAEKIRLSELAKLTKELLAKARAGKLSRDELSGGTFTISNLGMLGVDSFDAIINQPEAAILAVGSLRVVPFWDGEVWVPRSVISMTLSVDHRVADGADGARFLSDLQDGISNWELLM